MVQSPSNPQTLNRYSYAGNNPVNNIDPDGHSFWKKIGNFFKKAASAIISVAFTFVGMPFIGALVSSAVSTAINGGSFTDFGIGLGVGIVSGFAAGGIAGKIGGFFDMNKAGLGLAALRGGLGGAIAGAGTAAIYKQDIGRGALFGAAAGVGTASVMWGLNTMRTNDFIRNNVKLDPSYTNDQKANVMQSIRESGQSPVGGRVMSRFIRAGATLNMFPEAMRPDGIAMPGTAGNDMYFNGTDQSTAGYIANEPWGPSMDGGAIFTHEMGHASNGYSYTGPNHIAEPLNVSHTENLYRAWNGLPSRNDYGILSKGQQSIAIPNRSIWNGLGHAF